MGLKGVAFFSFVWLTVAARGLNDYLRDLPMQNPDLFGGDMLGMDDEEDRNAVVNKIQLWPDGVVYYKLDPGMSFFLSKMEGATDIYKKNTCIRFVERTNEPDYIRVFPGQGCYSHVGRTGGAQPLSLGPGCDWMGTVVHELGHALGFYHEQNRSDRDDYLIIYWDNIKDGMADQFMKLLPHQNRLLNKFDYESIMLYGEYAFSKTPRVLKTMSRKNDSKILREVAAKYTLSPSDIERVKILYNC